MLFDATTVAAPEVFMLRAFALILALFTTLPMLGCSSSPPPTEPEGGYLAFKQALLSRDPESLWATLSDDTKTLVRDSLDSLKSTNQLIDRLQPSDRKQAREAIGASLLDKLETPYELFRFVFVQENIPVDSAYELGLQLRSVNQVDDGRALVTTRSGQQIELIKDDDGYWRVRNPIHEQFAEAFAVMEQNRANVETAINLFSAAASEEAEIARLLGTDKAEDPGQAADNGADKDVGGDETP